jgi:diadenylate cyclase
MLENIIDFLTDWRAILQIVILFTLVYLAMYHLRNTHGSLVMGGLLMFIGSLWCLAQILALDVISRLLEMVLGSLFLMLMIIFQPELRRALARLGSLAMLENRRRKELIGEVISAVLNMSKRKCGAIVVIECKVRLQPLIDDAIILDAKVNSWMLESIFYPNSPLHDGAVIIRDDHIVAARAILPLSGSEAISRQLGTRHRAALGISEESDAVTVLVSEESGAVSIGHDGKLYRDLTPAELHKMLDTLIVKKDAGELDETIRQLNDDTELTDNVSEVNEAETGK